MNNIEFVFKKLVMIDSPSSNEQEMRKYLIAWLIKNKFTHKVDSVGNVYAINNNKNKPILFCAHMDTVEPGKNIKPVVKAGMIKSSGNTILGADNKAALAAILVGVEKYLEENKSPRSIELLFTVKEETGGGIEYLPFKWIRSKHGYIFDSAKPLGGVVLASPYIINFHFTIHGKAAHSSTPQLGNSALNEALKILNKIKCGEVDRGETTINIGTIKGGTGINTIPDLISFSGEVRSYDKKLFNKHLLMLQKLARSGNSKYKIIIETDAYCPGYTHSKNSPSAHQINKIYERYDLKTTFYGKSGVSDANILNSKNIQTINLTDGVKDPHTINESVAIKDLERLSNIVYDLIGKE